MKSVLPVLLILILASIGVFAAESLNGKWKGEITGAVCGGFSSPGGGGPGGGGPPGGGFPGGGGRGGLDFTFAASQRGGGGGGFGGPGGGGPPDGGFPGGGFGRRGGPQKVTLNIKAKEDKKSSEVKLTGNITIGETTEDVRDGKVDGMKIGFTTGKTPNPICEYAGEVDGSELRMTQQAAGGSVRTTQFTLKR